MHIETLPADEVLTIHHRLVKDFAASSDPISPPGLKNRSLLESAIGRQHVGIGSQSKYPTIHENAASLLYGLTLDHPFHNGNKRTALVSMLVHLDKNRHCLIGVTQSQIFQLMMEIADHQIIPADPRSKKSTRPSADQEVEALSRWIRDHVHRLQLGERQITYRALRQILNGFRFELENPKGNQIDVVKLIEREKGIFRKQKVTERKHLGAIGFPGERTFVSLKVLKQVRRMCNLTEDHGIDSAAFYDSDETIDEFINTYRRSLRRLAKN